MADPVNASIVEHFRTLEDPRIERTKKHNLLDILVIAVCTLLTGGEGFQDMELFGKSKSAWLQSFLALPNGIPSHDTFGRVFARLNPQRFQTCCLSWTRAVARLTHGALISLDGKTVQASFDRATAASPDTCSRPGVQTMVSLSWGKSRRRPSPMRSQRFQTSSTC